ncbi:hypothetical protein [Paraburkholderia terricola]|uniref:hypothetical protein n=1 Tax=Paraburkholderia terricola TaxID=169427 RepID=UPI0028609F31|nr:hypothetical protein [Paraburkholderia terricola]MDR6482891.1 hypothetical protein [Paraburkholderia terricola]
MSSRRLCPRHGFQGYIESSKDIDACIGARGQFAAGQLVKASFDRPKRSREVWVHLAELAEYAHLITYAGKTAHLKDFPSIAAIERSLVPVCPRCLGELLARSDEQPLQVTSRESAFDTSLVAEDANVSEDVLSCPIHGLVRPKRTSPQIADAIDSGGALPSSPLIKTILESDKHEDVFWFEASYLRRRFGPGIDLTSSTYRLNWGEQKEALLEGAVRVCPLCLRDFLIRNGIEV